MGCLSEVAEVAVDEMRESGLEVGLLKLRMWRPFPFADFRKAVQRIYHTPGSASFVELPVVTAQ
jgi:pyruvate ferredoxin oxidoreductase alpha subunit